MLLVAPAGISFTLQAAWWLLCQPWFYLRLRAYRFIGLSEEAYGRS